MTHLGQILVNEAPVGTIARAPHLSDEPGELLQGSKEESRLIGTEGVYVEIVVPLPVWAMFVPMEVSDGEGTDAEIASRQLRFEKSSRVRFDEDNSAPD